MKPRISFFMLPAIITLALLAAFLLTAPVFAQDEILPKSPPAEDPIAEEVPPVEEPTVEEVPEEVLVEASAETPAEIAGALEDASEAGVVLVDETGEPLALVTEEAAETMAGGDPWYKVGTVTYHFLSGVLPNTCANLYPTEVYPYCQENPHPIQAAINYVPTSGLPSDGFIYIEAGTYTDYPTINGLGDPLYNNLKGLIGTVVDYVPQVNLTGDIWVNNVEPGLHHQGL